jgi:nicotinate phosphoribosyltransferase
MMNGFFHSANRDKKAVFDMFYRKNPSGNGYAIAAGLEQLADYIENLHFSEEDIDYFNSLNVFTPQFLDYLRNFSFSGDIYAVPEGTVIFPSEPIIRVTAPIMEAQLIETALLNIINHQSLIATKASRVVYAAGGDAVLEFGLRRAQGPDAGLYGARAAIIGGCAATSNTLCGRLFDVPVKGTHAHSWVMSFPDELTAFRHYAKMFPYACILLVDTYDTLKSGVPNAITVFKEMQNSGIPLSNYGVRLDSGDFAYLSKEARKMLDEAGFTDSIISASSDLNEYLIQTLKQQGAKINLWGVGTQLITSDDCPAFGGVYKIAAQENEFGEMEPKIKLSENPEKITNPGVKKVFRIYSSKTHKAKADLITLEDEEIDASSPLVLFDPNNTWKKMILQPDEFYYKELLQPVFINGKRVQKSPTVTEIKKIRQESLDSFWDEHKRLINPQIYYVDLSDKLYELKATMLCKIRG